MCIYCTQCVFSPVDSGNFWLLFGLAGAGTFHIWSKTSCLNKCIRTQLLSEARYWKLKDDKVSASLIMFLKPRLRGGYIGQKVAPCSDWYHPGTHNLSFSNTFSLLFHLPVNLLLSSESDLLLFWCEFPVLGAGGEFSQMFWLPESPPTPRQCMQASDTQQTHKTRGSVHKIG